MTQQLPLDFEHEPSHLEDDFIEGEGNTLALSHIRSFPDWPHPLTLLTGPAKAGKSHLARIWEERSAALPVTVETVGTLVSSDRPLLIEDIDRAGFAEDALFHLLNRSIRAGRPTLMTARAPVTVWPYVTDDLKSRARLATEFTMVLSDDIQLSQVLVKLYSDRQIAVDPQVISYIVRRMERSPEEAVALVELTDRLAMAKGAPITRRIAATALAQRGVAVQDSALEGEDDE